MPGSPDKHTHSTQAHTLLLATDNKKSVVAEIAGGRANAIAYSAYGHQSASHKPATHLGFNGELREMSIGWCLLGNGYRAYNPILMRFHSPDSWSPFGAGGWNAYMYCGGEPVMGFDPSGHFNPSKWARNIKRIFDRSSRDQRALEAVDSAASASRQAVQQNIYVPLGGASRPLPLPPTPAPARPPPRLPPRVLENRRRGLPDGYEDYVPPPRRYLKKPDQPSFFQNVTNNAHGLDGRSSTPASVQSYSAPGSSGSRPSVQAGNSTYVAPLLPPRQQPSASPRPSPAQRAPDGNPPQNRGKKSDVSEQRDQVRRDGRRG